jgi:hypothetical protein
MSRKANEADEADELTSQRGPWSWWGNEAKVDDADKANGLMIRQGWHVDEADLANEATEADKADLCHWVIEADVAGKPTETDEAEANKANEAKADEADAEPNETGGAIVADEIKANVIDKIVAADKAIVIDEVIADDKAILIDE